MAGKSRSREEVLKEGWVIPVSKRSRRRKRHDWGQAIYDDRCFVYLARNENIRAAKFGIPEAQNEMGVRSYVGYYVKRDRNAALDWFTKAAEQGNADACFNLARCYAQGRCVEVNIDKSIEWLKRAVDCGSQEAALMLGEYYAEGRFVAKNVYESARLFRKACEQYPREFGFEWPAAWVCDSGKRIRLQFHDWLGLAVKFGVAEAQYFSARSTYDSVSYQRSFESNVKFADEYNRRAKEAFDLFQKAANNGHVPALKSLGDCYLTAFGVEKDVLKALDIYRLASEKGFAPAQNALADAYFNGESVVKDIAKAIELYEVAAAQGNANAQYSLGVCYYGGIGVREDLGKAWMLLTRAYHGRVDKAFDTLEIVESLVSQNEKAKWDEGRRMNPFSNSVSAAEQRVWMYNNEYPSGFVSGCARNIDWRKIAADHGEASAFCDIGFDLITKENDGQSWRRAAELFEKAASLGEPAAYLNLGKCLWHGMGVAPDAAKAVYWLRKACAAGFKDVELLLADCSLDGIGCDNDPDYARRVYRSRLASVERLPAAAFSGLGYRVLKDGRIDYWFSSSDRWIELMAQKGDAAAQFSYGLGMTLISNIPPEKAKEIFSWYIKSAEQGYAHAQNEVGECYEKGFAVGKDLSVAVEWYRKAAAQNDAKALYNLGMCYYVGMGVEQDWKKAGELFESAIREDKDGWRAGRDARDCLDIINDLKSDAKSVGEDPTILQE